MGFVINPEFLSEETNQKIRKDAIERALKKGAEKLEQKTPIKNTPSNCELFDCNCNCLPPPENSQECIACVGNIKKNWKPKKELQNGKRK